jgi:hypothetical protein
MQRSDTGGFPGSPGMFAPPNTIGGPGPFASITPVQMGNVPSPIKRFANWNACFSCGFDVEDGHISMTCPMQWHKPNHQVGYTRENAAGYAAYAPCTKGQHKTQFPQAQYQARNQGHM